MDDEAVAVLREINNNLRAIRILTEIQLRGPVKDELSQLASSLDRKRIWSLCDGSASTTDIARRVGVTRRTVQYFARDGVKLGLLTVNKRGYPCRTIDWIPPEWEALATTPRGSTKEAAEEDEEL